MSLINIPENLKYKPKSYVKPLNLTSKDLITPKYSDRTTKLFDPYKYCMEQLLVTYGY